jgi:hypothetical protein
MRAESVVRHELIGDLLCERGIDAPVSVDFRRLLVLAFVGRSKRRASALVLSSVTRRARRRAVAKVEDLDPTSNLRGRRISFVSG